MAKEKDTSIDQLKELMKPYKDGFIKSVILASLGVFSGMIPYFIAARIVGKIVSGNKDFQGYIALFVIAVIGVVLKTLFMNLSTASSHIATYNTLKDIRIKMIKKLSSMPMGYILETPSGKLKNTIVDRVESMETILAHLIPEITSNILIPIVIVLYILYLDPLMALVALATVPIGFLCFKGMTKGYTERFKKMIQKVRTMNSTVIEYVNGIEVIKAFNQSAKSYDKYTKAVNDNARYAVDWMSDTQIYKSLSFSIWPAVLIAVLPFGCYFNMRGTLSAENLITIVILSLGLISPIMDVINYTDNVSQLKTIIGEVGNFLNQVELKRPEISVKIPNTNIEMKNVYFSYDRNPSLENMVIKYINLNIQPSTINAFVGPSGGGKSTIIKLIAGFWDVTKGEVIIGGINIKDIPQSELMDKIAYVSQDNYLFDDTVMENIRIGKKGATEDEVIKVAKDCGCHDFIMGLENGYNTVVGGNGGHLSGGERQRIAIARVMLKDAPIIILDEATAYTDPENEAIIQEAIAKLIQGKTLLMIAHRLSTIVDVDCIFVIKDGEINSMGTHEELLNSSLLYSTMWRAHIDAKDKM
ncbi:ATP-binding cassette subfamily B protein [Clostridium tetanomorphum]|uniref:ABC transporter ATP-binding protein n=1 Tax=Clostridium tetanomorphum TaxID=1553 RepID=UPI000445AB51|nr:ABC transporter ATP-binding protein [Clostridium tetanomorphum]KAJ49803.1 ABC transporter ATP-binding protein/permease [Clostridium tetanomorphum DSM 665]MBP1865104.1 ATP-binding cassette subfamily B protein [Clostridium tetanomorphum]NRS84757.1 ATP-binding cassette subfamily B protein [Clostridium tetanomorphum]SQB91740.1 ABC transporter ATP-binding protein/permease [Clostridium tetanomorphum]